jgi:hypothetical protein
MIDLNVPVPELRWKPSGAPQIEQPVEVRLPAIRLPDGTEATDADAQKVGAYVYRYGAAGEELWNETEQSWGDAPADLGALPPVALAYKKGDPFPWQGMLIAIGLKDRDGQPRFSKAAGGEPRYRLRAYAKLKRDGADYAGLSALSPELAFVGAGETQRFAVTMTPEDPQQTEKVRIQLKNASLAPAGYLEIRASGGQEVEIANCDASGNKLASLRLGADGAIYLEAQKVVLNCNLETRQIRYLSSDGVTMKNLA